MADSADSVVEWSWLCEDCGAGGSGFGEREMGRLERCRSCGSVMLSWEIDDGVRYVLGFEGDDLNG